MLVPLLMISISDVTKILGLLVSQVVETNGRFWLKIDDGRALYLEFEPGPLLLLFEDWYPEEERLAASVRCLLTW